MSLIPADSNRTVQQYTQDMLLSAKVCAVGILGAARTYVPSAKEPACGAGGDRAPRQSCATYIDVELTACMPCQWSLPMHLHTLWLATGEYSDTPVIMGATGSSGGVQAQRRA